MRSRILILALVVAVTVLIARPRPVQAGSDVTTPLIISGSITGGVALIYLIAIAASGDKEPDFLELVPRRAQETASISERVRFATQCPLSDGTTTLLCW